MPHNPPHRILIGGVPFGQNNVGDEAILLGTVRLLRQLFPESTLMVSTDKESSIAGDLPVERVPLYGFGRSEDEQFAKVLERTDLFLWAGATGLSDYPEASTALLRHAREKKVPVCLFGCGMNDRLNPMTLSIGEGKKQRAAQFVDDLLGGRVDCAKLYEKWLSRRVISSLVRELRHALCIVTRDSASKDLLLQADPSLEITVGADPAILLHPIPLHQQPLPHELQCRLQAERKIGICISAQRPTRQLHSLVQALDAIISGCHAHFFAIPINPITDLTLMQELKDRLFHKEKFTIIEGISHPEKVAGLAQEMDLVISSRLHLLILASLSHTPLIGLRRGSKIDNYLAHFGLKPAGTAEHPDYPVLLKECRKWLIERETFKASSEKALLAMRERLTTAGNLLVQAATTSQDKLQ